MTIRDPQWETRTTEMLREMLVAAMRVGDAKALRDEHGETQFHLVVVLQTPDEQGRVQTTMAATYGGAEAIKALTQSARKLAEIDPEARAVVEEMARRVREATPQTSGKDTGGTIH